MAQYGNLLRLKLASLTLLAIAQAGIHGSSLAELAHLELPSR